MRQRFFTSTAQTRLIKNILSNTPIPIYDTVRPGDYIIKNCKYIYNISLIKCTKSGTLEGTGEFITLDYTFYWGIDKLNETERLRDNTGFYDSRVHEWLGKYLRAYRDMVGINLMPFYNCFSGVYTSRFNLVPININNKYIISVYESTQSYDTYSQGSEEFNNTYIDKNPYKILQIPIKLNRKYTIAIDCDSTVRIAPAFINHGHLVKVNIGTDQLSLTELLINGEDSSLSIEKTNTVFLEPFVIDINSKNQTAVNGIITEEDIGLTYEQLLQRYEKYLYLLIQLPSANTSSIVVLEGDYANVDCNNIFSLENINELNLNIYNNIIENEYEVLAFKTNEFTTISSAPYMACLNIENLSFIKNKLFAYIFSITSQESYGNLEYYFTPATETSNYNLYIFSYVPITVGTIFNISWCNFEDISIEKIISANNIQENDALLDEFLLSKLSLLQFNDQKNYPFADRLIEYLTLNVIDSADEISDNIKRAQDYFGVSGRKYSTYGAWNNYLRIIVYLRSIRDKILTHLDNNGYIDKIVESLMQSQRGD